MPSEKENTPGPGRAAETIYYVENVDGDDFTFYLSAGDNAGLLPPEVSSGEGGQGKTERERYSYARPLTVVRLSPLLKARDVKKKEGEFYRRLRALLAGGEQPFAEVLGEVREEIERTAVEAPPKELLPKVLGKLNAWVGDPSAGPGGGVEAGLDAQEREALSPFSERGRRAYLRRRYLEGHLGESLKPCGPSRVEGRSIVSRAYRGGLLSVTFRVKKSSSSYKPGKSKSAQYPISMEDYCRTLYEAISKVEEMRGLLVITGATNSAKSEIATGLIYNYLEERKGDATKGRPHLVTFEDPVEKWYAPAPGAAASGTCSVETGAAAQMGVDYTPREKGDAGEQGKDVRSLAEALADALRQTPAVFFVGETRDKEYWRLLIDFAGTGHLIVTTAHAGSLSEAMHKIFEALKVRTPAERSEIANRLLGVVHINVHVKDDRNVLLPALWRRTPTGRNSLTAEGLSSLLPYAPKADDGEKGCLGRSFFAECLVRGMGAGADDARRAATEWDLEGV